MKTTAFTFIAVSMAITAFDSKPSPNVAADQLAQKVISALHKSSSIHFSALYPSVELFYELMHENSALYGSNFEEAKATFTNDFEKRVVPAMNSAFENVISQGQKAGIDWKSIKLQSVECNGEEKNFSRCSITIAFSSNNKTHKLRVDDAIYYNGQWKVSKNLSLQ